MSQATVPPCPRSPAVWQFARYNFDYIRYMDACHTRHGDVFMLRLFPFGKVVVASAPADVKAVLTDTTRFAGGEANEMLEPVTGPRSVLLATGATHMRKRKLLLPAFHGDLVERWEQRVEAVAQEELNRLALDRPVSMRPSAQRIALDVICRLVFGFDDPQRIASFSEAIRALLDPRFALGLPIAKRLERLPALVNPMTIVKRRRALAHQLIQQEIDRRRIDPDRGERDDALSLLIDARDEDGNAMDDAELRDELVTLLVAGHETTATAIAWTFERLSRTPSALERLTLELAEGDGSYLDAAIQESLRIRPPVIDAARIATSDTTLGGHLIPAGTLVAALFTLTHRRADVWEDPLAFKPERFLGAKPAPYAFVPFGGGVRRCIGAALATLEMRVVLRVALRRFSLSAPPRQEESIRLSGVTLIPSRGGSVILRPLRPGMSHHPRTARSAMAVP
jgi:cytochrome P450